MTIHLKNHPILAIAIGGSAGSVDALQKILHAVGKDFPCPIFTVIHLPPTQPSLLATLFNARLPITVKEAEDKEPIQNGTLYFAPPNYHLLIERNRSLSLSMEEPHHYSRPSIDVLFESAADTYGNGLLGILLTGANEDGAQGLKAISDAGGRTWVQDPKKSQVPTMPAAAIKLFRPHFVGTLNEIGSRIANLNL